MYTLGLASKCKALKMKPSKAICMMAITQFQPARGSGPSRGCKNLKSIHIGGL